MANSFLTIKNIARQALPRLIENLVFPNLIHRDFDSDFEQGKGATIQVRKPVVLEAKEFGSKIEIQDITDQSVDVTLDKLATVDVSFTAMERAAKATPPKGGGRQAREFFVRCKRGFRRLTGGKSRKPHAADGGKGTA